MEVYMSVGDHGWIKRVSLREAMLEHADNSGSHKEVADVLERIAREIRRKGNKDATS